MIWDYVLMDLETNGFNPNKIHMIGVQNLITGDYESFVGIDGVAEAVYYASTESKMVVGHAFNFFDGPVIENLTGIEIERDKIVDTVDMSRDYCELPNHKLQTWGDLLGFPKLPQPNFDEYSQIMDTYCERDVRLNTKMFFILYRMYLESKPPKLHFNNRVLDLHRDALAQSTLIV